MTPQPKSTIVITGGNGVLGSAVAVEIDKLQQGKYHMILTARSLTDPRTIQISSTLKALGSSFEFQVLDLSSLGDVRAFAAALKVRIGKNEVPPFAEGGIVNSAATFNFLKDSRTKDGWSEMYGIDVLAPMLLVREMLPVC